MNKKMTNYFLGKIRKGERVLISDDGKNYYITDGYMSYITSKDKLEINPLIIKEKVSYKVMMCIGCKYSEAEIIYYNKSKTDDKLYAVLEDKEGNKTYIKDNYVKMFNANICTFMTSGESNPVRVYQDNNLVGVICPRLNI